MRKDDFGCDAGIFIEEYGCIIIKKSVILMAKLSVFFILLLLMCSCNSNTKTQEKAIHKNGVMVKEQRVSIADTGAKEKISSADLPLSVIVLMEKDGKYLVYDAIRGKYFVDKEDIILDAEKIKEILFNNRFKDLVHKLNCVNDIDSKLKILKYDDDIVKLLLEKGKLLSEIGPVDYDYLKENPAMNKKYNIKEYYYEEWINYYYDGHEYRVMLDLYPRYAKQALIGWGNLLLNMKEQKIFGNDADIKQYKEYIRKYPQFEYDKEIKQIVERL